MVGLIVATHGQLAAELLRTAEGIVGPLPAAAAISIDSSTSVEEARARLATAIHKCGADGDGVLVLTDMFGGTPANLALTFLDEQIEVVTGVNLPMLMKLGSARGAGLAAAAELATAQGQKNITLASALLRARTQPGRG
jgi:PTS system mannose-specific IIA component